MLIEILCNAVIFFGVLLATGLVFNFTAAVFTVTVQKVTVERFILMLLLSLLTGATVALTVKVFSEICTDAVYLVFEGVFNTLLAALAALLYELAMMAGAILTYLGFNLSATVAKAYVEKKKVQGNELYLLKAFEGILDFFFFEVEIEDER